MVVQSSTDEASTPLADLIHAEGTGRRRYRTRPGGAHTLSLLDQGLCEQCVAPAVVLIPKVAIIQMERGANGSAAGQRKYATEADSRDELCRGGPDGARGPLRYKLTVQISFRAVVSGPHLIYLREDFGCDAAALSDAPPPKATAKDMPLGTGDG